MHNEFELLLAESRLNELNSFRNMGCGGMGPFIFDKPSHILSQIVCLCGSILKKERERERKILVLQIKYASFCSFFLFLPFFIIQRAGLFLISTSMQSKVYTTRIIIARKKKEYGIHSLTRSGMKRREKILSAKQKKKK
jgi:hypothetical protein